MLKQEDMARLDTGWHAHPKLLRLGLAAMGLHAWSISYCDSTRSDGFVPNGAWPALPGVNQARERLVEAGLWVAAPDGYLLHDYTDYNRTREQIAAEQAEARARMRHVRANKPRTKGERSPEVQPKFARSSRAPGPGPFKDGLPGSARADAAPRAHARVDPALQAEHLMLLAAERASRARPGQPDFLSENGDEKTGC